MKTILIVFALLLSGFTLAHAEEKWAGVDDVVVGKISNEHGRTVSKPFIELEGDTELFAFLTAGAVGGFGAGYFWRMLMEKKSK